jgi:hypothetical protein
MVSYDYGMASILNQRQMQVHDENVVQYIGVLETMAQFQHP